MTSASLIVVDTSVLVALVDRRDKWHASAESLRKAIDLLSPELVYFDPVVSETFSVLARRAREQGRTREFSGLMENLLILVPGESPNRGSIGRYPVRVTVFTGPILMQT